MKFSAQTQAIIQLACLGATTLLPQFCNLTMHQVLAISGFCAGAQMILGIRAHWLTPDGKPIFALTDENSTPVQKPKDGAQQ
jgi:hypothetical protein